MYCWHDTGTQEVCMDHLNHFAIGSETACPLFATVKDFVFYRWQFAITFSFSSASLATVIRKEEIKIIKLQKPSSGADCRCLNCNTAEITDVLQCLKAILWQ